MVYASEHEHADLFRALKGGGANIGVLWKTLYISQSSWHPPAGIVTRFDLYTQSEYKVWYSMKAYNVTDIAQVMNATISIQKAMEKDDKIGLAVSVLKDMFVVLCCYRGWDVAQTFEAFHPIPVVAVIIPETSGTQQSAARALGMVGNAKYVKYPSIFFFSN